MTPRDARILVVGFAAGVAIGATILAVAIVLGIVTAP